MSQHPRFAARDAVLMSPAMSDKARLVYLILDNMAGVRAEAWPKQQTLAAYLGASEREVRRALAELCAAGLLDSKKSLGHSIYSLTWGKKQDFHSQSIRTPTSASKGVDPDAHVRSIRTPTSASHLTEGISVFEASRPVLASTPLREIIEHFQRQFPGSAVASEEVTDHLLARIAGAGAIETEEDAISFERFLVARVKGGRAPGRANGPRGLGLLVEWAKDFSAGRGARARAATA